MQSNKLETELVIKLRDNWLVRRTWIFGNNYSTIVHNDALSDTDIISPNNYILNVDEIAHLP
jgi:hypothetical protein